MKRFALFVAVVFAIVLSLVLAWQLLHIILTFGASLALAATLRAPIERLMARGAPRGLAIALVYVLVGFAAVALLYFLYQRLGRELVSLSEDLSYLYSRLRAQFSVLWQFSPGVTSRFPTPEQISKLLTDGQIGSLERGLMGATQNLAGTLGNFALVLILSVYWTADRLHFERLALSLLPATRRSAVRNIWRAIETGLGRYLRSELLQSLLAGVMLVPVFMLLDFRWPVFWALAASLARLVPLVGALLVIVPMAVVVWVQSGPLVAALAVVATLIVVGILEFFVERRLYIRERGVNVLTIVVVLIMADAFGLLGLLLAPPLAAAIHILLAELASPNAALAPRPALTVDVTALEARLAGVRGLMAAQGDGKDRRLESLVDRLEALLAEAQRVEG